MNIEELAREAFMAYHNYNNIEDWDKLPKTREKWIKVVNVVLKELEVEQTVNQQTYA